MGLDMYLNGNAYYHGLSAEELKTQPVEQIFRLGYWRKHPDLHGYIVQEFADGIDDCLNIELGITALTKIILAIQYGKLPHTTGFFFGESENDNEQQSEAIAIFEAALTWLTTDDERSWRSVHYRASW